MSTFSGELQELPGVCVDNFSSTSFKCYFLSHCHSDHIREIDTFDGSDLPIYTTPLSTFMLRQKYPKLNVVQLEIGNPAPIEYTIESEKSIRFVVTLLNGGHCLGSCMILFQVEGRDVLYTGDFRISLDEARNIRALREVSTYGELAVYLDTTFMKKEYTHFPRQSESCSKVVEIVQNHLRKSSSNRVILQVSARYGYERLCIELHRRLNEKIFIGEEDIAEQYLAISEMSSCVSKASDNARITLTRHKARGGGGGGGADKNVLFLHLSAMYWSEWKKGEEFIKETGTNRLRVCYATHSSMSEIRDFLTLLRPKVVHATVVPENTDQRLELMRLIDETVNAYQNGRAQENISPRFTFKKLRRINA